MTDNVSKTVKNAGTALMGFGIIGATAFIVKDLFDANLTILDAYYLVIGIVLVIFSIVITGLAKMIDDISYSKKALVYIAKDLSALKENGIVATAEPSKTEKADKAKPMEKKEEKPSIKLDQLKSEEPRQVAPAQEKQQVSEARPAPVRTENTAAVAPIKKMVNPTPLTKAPLKQAEIKSIHDEMTTRPVRPTPIPKPVAQQPVNPQENDATDPDLSYFFKRPVAEVNDDDYTVPTPFPEYKSDAEVEFDTSDIYQEPSSYAQPEQHSNYDMRRNEQMVRHNQSYPDPRYGYESQSRQNGYDLNRDQTRSRNGDSYNWQRTMYDNQNRYDSYQSPDLNMNPFEKNVNASREEDTSEMIRRLSKKKKTNPSIRSFGN